MGRNKWIETGYDDAIEAVKSYCGKVAYMEVKYPYGFSYKTGKALGPKIEDCPNVVVRLEMTIYDLEPFHVANVIFNYTYVSENVDLAKMFPKMTKLTVNGIMTRRCAVNYPELAHVIINWNDWGLDLRISQTLPQFGALETVQILALPLGTQSLINLAKVSNAKNAYMICDGNEQAVFDFLKKPVSFEGVKLVFANVGSERFDEIIAKKNRIVSNIPGNAAFDEFHRLLDSDANESMFTDDPKNKKESDEIRYRALPLWTVIEEGYDGIPILTFQV